MAAFLQVCTRYDQWAITHVLQRSAFQAEWLGAVKKVNDTVKLRTGLCLGHQRPYTVHVHLCCRLVRRPETVSPSGTTLERCPSSPQASLSVSLVSVQSVQATLAIMVSNRCPLWKWCSPSGLTAQQSGIFGSRPAANAVSMPNGSLFGSESTVVW